MNKQKNKRLLVTGSTGMLGAYITEELKHNKKFDFIGHSHRGLINNCDFSITNDSNIYLTKHAPDIIINLIGSVSVDDCEKNIENAVKINVDTIRNISNWSKNNGCRLIHISTDHVYDNNNISMSNESLKKLVNNYSITKYIGEQFALGANATVLRTNFVGKSIVSGKQSLTDWVYKICDNNEESYVLNNVFFSPLTMKQLSKYLVHIANLNHRSGIFNLGSKGCMSKSEFDIYFANKLGLSTDNLTEIPLEEADFLNAERPKGMCMDSSLFEKEFNITLPTIKEVLEDAIGDYNEY